MIISNYYSLMKKYNNISLIGAASGWGGRDQLTADGPLFIKKNSSLISRKLYNKSVDVFWRSILETNKTFKKNILSKLTFEELEELIIDFCLNLSNEVIYTVNGKSFPLILGGDHSIAIGTWSGIAKANSCHEKLALIWIDAHMDAHTPKTSPSKAVHGMPLALLMGYGSSKIQKVLFDNKIIINPEHLILIGVRSFEKEEQKLLKKLGVKVYYAEEVFNKGFEKVFNNALEYLAKLTSFVGLSIDIDAFDPKFAPGTSCKEPKGLLPSEFFMTINKIKFLDTFVGLEIAEYNPSLDQNFITLNLILNIIRSVAG